jgi:hypothetical protein
VLSWHNDNDINNPVGRTGLGLNLTVDLSRFLLVHASVYFLVFIL